MASFDFDQAEGLRRMLAGPRPRIFTFISATPDDEKNAMLVNLGASLARISSDILLLDASAASQGVASRLRANRGTALSEAVRQEHDLNNVVQMTPQGFGVATLGRALPNGADHRLGDAFSVLAKKMDVLLVDAELDANDSFPVPAIASGEIVVQVSTSAASIKAAYGIIKRLNEKSGKRPFNILVTGASDREATRVYENMAQAASRYLAVQLTSMGSIPADEHLTRAAHLGRTVIDAFPMASASVAFRNLAARFAPSGASAAGVHTGA